MATTKVRQSTANAAKASFAYELAKQANCARNAVLSSPGLVIKAGGSALAKAGSLFYWMVAGVMGKTAANTDMPALVGTVANAQFGIYFWTIDASGTLAQLTLATGATLAAIVLPDFPIAKAVVGAVIVNPTGTGGFVGGTTALDDGTVIPGAVYINGSACGGVFGNLISFYETGLPS